VKLKDPDQFQYFLKLCDWTHRQWKRSVPDPYPLSNAIDILKDIRSGKTGGFCGQYAYVLADVLKSLGFFSVRCVELWSSRAKNQSHFVVEAWSDRYEKWIILDPDYNIYYESVDNGIPANAYEIRESLLGGPKVRAQTITSTTPNPEIKDDENIHLYANFAVSLRSDLMRHTTPLTIGDRFHMFLFFIDKNTTDFYAGQGVADTAAIPYSNITDRKDDLYYDCNSVRVEYERDEKTGNIELLFFTDNSMPNFRFFSISEDNGKTWKPVQGNKYPVRKSKEKVDILVVPVNMYGRPGCRNKISIQF
ncbi:MAG: transglutaminase domain-containing protein, partial [bacterium]|nr:transglutaminase domain-containing protein [bacterium]